METRQGSSDFVLLSCSEPVMFFFVSASNHTFCHTPKIPENIRGHGDYTSPEQASSSDKILLENSYTV